MPSTLNTSFDPDLTVRSCLVSISYDMDPGTRSCTSIKAPLGCWSCILPDDVASLPAAVSVFASWLTGVSRHRWSFKSTAFTLLGFCHYDPDVFISAAVVEEPAVAFAHSAFDKHNVRNLPLLLPPLLYIEDRFVRAHQHLPGIILIKQHPTRRVNAPFVGAVIN